MTDLKGNKYWTIYQNKSKYFRYPYAGCSDDHTYLNFLLRDIERDGNLVYFYQPDFSNVTNTENFTELIEKRIKEEIEIAKKQYVVCD